jgi:hypothetical protein
MHRPDPATFTNSTAYEEALVDAGMPRNTAEELARAEFRSRSLGSRFEIGEPEYVEQHAGHRRTGRRPVVEADERVLKDRPSFFHTDFDDSNARANAALTDELDDAGLDLVSAANIVGEECKDQLPPDRGLRAPPVRPTYEPNLGAMPARSNKRPRLRRTRPRGAGRPAARPVRRGGDSRDQSSDKPPPPSRSTQHCRASSSDDDEPP